MASRWRRFAFLFVLAAGLFAAGCTPSGPPGGGSDDDRPPIIVSGGSVDLRIVAKTRGNGYNYTRGSWVQVSTTKWYHDHSKQTAKHLFVNVVKGSGGTNCDQLEYDFDVLNDDRITIAYGTGLTATIYRDNDPNLPQPQRGRLTVEAPQGTVDSNVPFWLILGGATDYPTSVRFPVPDPRANTDTTTCTLSQYSQIQIHQVRH